MFDEKPWFLFRPGARLEELRTFYEYGVIPALYDALTIVIEGGFPTPEWVLEGARAVVADRLKQGFTTGKGASGNELAQHRNDTMHLCRWLVVTELKKQGLKGEKLYEVAADRLKGRTGAGGEDTIRRSFRIVEKHLKHPDHRWRYYRALPEVQELTGIPGVSPGHKP